MFFAGMDMMALLVTVIMLGSTLSTWRESDKPTKEFVINMILYVIGLACNIASYYVPVGGKEEALLTFFTIAIGVLMSIGFSYFCVLQVNLREKVISIWIARAVLIINAVSLLVATVAFCKGTLFDISTEYFEASALLIAVYLVEFVTAMFVTVVLIIHAKKIESKTLFVLISLTVLPIMAAVAEDIVPGLYISYCLIVISMVLQYIFIQSQKIYEHRAQELAMNEVLRTNVMTGLKNRRAYTEMLNNFGDTGVNAGVAFFDVNGLKRVNDEQGHMEGDELIIRFANMLKEDLKHGDVFRISGDEFVAVYFGDEKRDFFVAECSTVHDDIKKHNNIAAMGAYYTAGLQIEEIIKEAEQRMYSDKQEYYEESGFDRRRNRQNLKSSGNPR